MDNAVTAAVGYFDNAAIFRVAFILFSVGRSVFVSGSDIGSKILTWSHPLRVLDVRTERELALCIHSSLLPWQRGTTKWPNQKPGKAGRLKQKVGEVG